MKKKKNFRLTKISEKDRKDSTFVIFHMFSFHENILFSELSFKRKCKKAASFCKRVFLPKYKFSYTIAGRKDEIFYIVLQLKQAIGQLFVEDIDIFPITSCRKHDRRIADLFFFSFMVINFSSL